MYAFLNALMNSNGYVGCEIIERWTKAKSRLWKPTSIAIFSQLSSNLNSIRIKYSQNISRDERLTVIMQISGYKDRNILIPFFPQQIFCRKLCNPLPYPNQIFNSIFWENRLNRKLEERDGMKLDKVTLKLMFSSFIDEPSL